MSRSPRLPAAWRSSGRRRGSAAGRESPCRSLSLEDDGGGGDAGAVGERDVQLFHAPRARTLRRLPAQRQAGRATVRSLHFHLQERHTLAPSRPQRLEARFLGGEAGGQRVGLVGPPGAVEIGRASGRERGEISVVAVSLKKKTQDMNGELL